ncbi:hypothetical protein [Ralstonia flaminis]|jgi:hypothetical protein|uniref:Uncharacterized protein n=1 Tax=Ralstonia flaminis TaxID=3058597 RepID=A0ABN9JTL9_9RALS|nr:hypothetical protein [Ralstonia sp. LMG 18101]CAJ0819043.1 hypothetical protein LMG18101_03815 [Ralstonia sp. LMG 18101]
MTAASQPGTTRETMPGYRTLASLTVRHPYFAPGRPDALHLRAEPAAAALMARFDLHLRGDARHAVMLAPERQLAGLWSERDAWLTDGLVLALHSSDPQWACYTDVRMLAAGGTFRPSPEQVGQLRQDAASEAGGRAGVLARLQLPLAPSGCDSLAAWIGATAESWTLELPVRATTWKYLLLGDWADDVRLVDLGDAVAFGEPARETLPDGREAITIRSLAPIALQERPPHRFQLRRGTGNAERVLMTRMPMAAPDGLRREVVDGAPCDVSEIFVSR